MPHRLPIATHTALWIIDGIVLGFASFIALFDSLSVGDLTGPHALVIGSVGVSWVLWNNGKERDKKFMEVAERHHSEMMDLQQSAHVASAKAQAELAALTSESIKVGFMVASEMKSLTAELEKRPCAVKPK